MESFIAEYITSFDADDVNEEMVLERRMSPYVTLRPGDISSLLKLHASLPFPGTGTCNKFGGQQEEGLSSDDAEDESGRDTESEVICRGADQHHIPAVYTVRGIKRHEFPVVGVYVDERVCPGFRYKVRRAGSQRFFYNNQAKTLESVGMGYGKRLTFSGDSLNNNDCFFWSDSDPEGFAFSIQAVEEGTNFLITVRGEEGVVGEAQVTSVHDCQEETAMTSQADGGVSKQVDVTLTLCVTYYHRHHHGLVDVMQRSHTEVTHGTATLSKPRRSRRAELTSVNNVFLQRFGRCQLIPDC